MYHKLIPHRLKSRLLLTYLVLMIFSLGGLILWTGLRLQRSMSEQEEHNLELQAALIANAFRGSLHDEDEEEHDSRDASYLSSTVRSFSLDEGVQITVMDARYQVIASTRNVAPRLSIIGNIPPELVDARQGVEQHAVRQEPGQDEKYIFVAVPVFSGEDRPTVAGIVQLASPFGPLNARIKGMWLGLLAAGGAVLAVTAGVSIFFAGRLSAPLKRLTEATDSMAAGDLNQRVVPEGPDEMERLAMAFNAMAERVQELLARQQAFVSDAAHELRSPLTGTRLRLEMLKDYGDTENEVVKEYLGQSLKDMDHLQRLVDHLLALSCLDQSQTLPSSDLDLSPILYGLTDEMSLLFQASELNFNVKIPPHLPVVAANPEAMRMVVRNLLDNAIQYTHPGGSVTLHAEPSNGGVRIAVSDNGQGIPPEDKPHVFERFYRADRARSRRQGGAGLGLSLVRAITESYGGTVAVESELDEGTTFTVMLPTLTKSAVAILSSAKP